MINAVYLILAEDAGEFTVEFLSRGEITSKGFFNHDTGPGLFIVVKVRRGRARQACTTELMNDLGVSCGRRSQVEYAIALGAFLLVEGIEQICEFFITFSVVKSALTVIQAFSNLLLFFVRY